MKEYFIHTLGIILTCNHSCKSYNIYSIPISTFFWSDYWSSMPWIMEVIFFASIVFKSSFPIFVLIFFINLTNAEGRNFFLGKKLWKMHILSCNKHDDLINKTCCVCNKTRNITKMLRILQFLSNFVQLNIQII